MSAASIKLSAWPCIAAVALLPVVSLAGAAPDIFTVYIQQAWPKQTTTNQQIHDLNAAFGTNFDDWGDVANLSLGAQALWSVAPGWKIGVQVDYGSGAIDGHAQVETAAGAARLEFEQRYKVYADLYGVAQWNPWPEMERMQPFLYAAIGAAYESDTTKLRLHNDIIDSRLEVKNDGWFPTYTAGLGIDIPFSAGSPWYVEVGVAYVWARMTNEVPATGDLAPSPIVTADTDLTGPNYWLGIGHRF